MIQKAACQSLCNITLGISKGSFQCITEKLWYHKLINFPLWSLWYVPCKDFLSQSCAAVNCMSAADLLSFVKVDRHPNCRTKRLLLHGYARNELSVSCMKQMIHWQLEKRAQFQRIVNSLFTWILYIHKCQGVVKGLTEFSTS